MSDGSLNTENVYICCNIECPALAFKWTDVQIHLNKFIQGSDSITFPKFVGIFVPAKYMNPVCEVITAALDRNVLYSKRYGIYVVDTRDFISGREPYMCVCGKRNQGSIPILR